MKKLNKKIFLVASIIFVFNIFFVSTVLAVDFTPELQVNFGNSSIDFKSVTCTKGENCSIGWIGQYVGALYNYGIGLAVILAIVMIMVGGFVWLLSAGSPDKVKTAKDFITSSITGLSLALFSFIILQAVNPNLVSFSSLNVVSPQEIEVGESTPQRIAQATAARGGSTDGGGGRSTASEPNLNLWDEHNQGAITQIAGRPGIESVSTYSHHDDDTQSSEWAADIWPYSSQDGRDTASWMMENYEELGISYIIYEDRIWNSSSSHEAGRQIPFDSWRNGGRPGDHDNHIHVSFIKP